MFSQHEIQLIDQKIINTIHGSASYILNEDYVPLPLTTRQQTCLFLLARGKTVKQIANILSISTRTVEEHIESIKHRLNCYSKSQVIEKAIDSGFLYYIPKEFLNGRISKIT